MIIQFIGKPGCGKTTHLAKAAVKENKRIISGRSCYERVLTNVAISGLGESSCVYLFKNDDFGKYDMSRSLILFDEAMLQFDSRDFKQLTSDQRNFLMLHRHYKSDIYFYSQSFGSLDKKIRDISDRIYLMYKVFDKTCLRRIEQELFVPKNSLKNKLDVQGCDEPIVRYYQVGFFQNIFEQLLGHKNFKRKKYYKFFDSYEAPKMPKKVFKQCK